MPSPHTGGGEPNETGRILDALSIFPTYVGVNRTVVLKLRGVLTFFPRMWG